MLRFLTTAAVATICSIATAQDGSPAEAAKGPSLSIGDKAPKPEVAKVIKGDFPKKFEDGKVYVVEFWATWCPPCRDSMPHLSKLQKEYKDKGVTIIGISDETEQKVSDFLAKGDWPQKTQYTIAIDNEDKTGKAYMQAAGQSGIPTAFIVGKTGQIEWIGHPMGMDDPLSKVVAGEWDRTAAKEARAKERAFEREMSQAQAKLMEAFQKQDWDGMMKTFDRLKEMAPPDMVGQIEMQQFMVLLTMANQPDRAYQIADQMIAENGDDPMMMNMLAWTIATDPSITNRDLAIALKAAQAGVKATDGKDPNILDTLATVLWEHGQKEEAIKTEEKAISLSDNDDAKAEFKAKLAEWKAELSTAG